MATVREEQFSGCLIGQCLGDALGFVVEGQSGDVCRRYVRDTLGTDPLAPGGGGPLRFGQYSDDSQLAREFVQSYVERRGFEPCAYAARIAAIFGEGRIVGGGRITAAAAERLRQGVPWHQAGTPPPAAGNGSAMRAGPVGLICFDDPDRLCQTAHDQGRITHQDGRCSAGAVAIAGGVALALAGGRIHPPAFLHQLSAWARPHDASVADYLERLVDWLKLPPEEAAGPISQAGQTPTLFDRRDGISPFVTGSVLWSLYAFLRTPDDYWQTIGTAIGVGGDVDTTAAMAGAISGAYLGLSALPLRLAERLTDRGTWGFAELVELAGRCYGIKQLADKVISDASPPL
ncbi:MAG: ADP-ribosylglycohydrolase family protein [Gemmataceae bacterium]